MKKTLFIFCVTTSTLQIFSMMIGPQTFAQVVKRKERDTTSLHSINTIINEFIAAGYTPHTTPFDELPSRLQQLMKTQKKLFSNNKRAR
jgi:hypothetical protein